MCAGALLAVGILNCGVQHENDPAYALLYDFVEKEDPVVRVGAIMGLGLAYSGTRKEEVRAVSPKRACVFPSRRSCCRHTGAVLAFPGVLLRHMQSLHPGCGWRLGK